MATISKSEFAEMIAIICPHCRGGSEPRYQAHSDEFVHQTSGKGTFTIAICWANGLRKSRFAENLTDG